MKRSQIVWVFGILALQLGGAKLALAQDELANLPDPTRPSTAAGASRGHTSAADKIARLRLESTLVSGDRRLAIINGEILAVGDIISGARIKVISPYLVILEHEGRLVTLRLVNDNLTRRRGLQEAAR